MVIDNLREIFLDVNPGVDVSIFNENSRLVEDLKLDSLSQLMVCMKMEEEFNIHFEKFITFKTVSEVLDWLKAQGIKD